MAESQYFADRVDRGFEEISKGLFGPKMVKPAGKHAKPRPKTSKKEEEAARQGFRAKQFERGRDPGTTPDLNPYKRDSKEGIAYGRGKLEYDLDPASGHWLSRQPGRHAK